MLPARHSRQVFSHLILPWALLLVTGCPRGGRKPIRPTNPPVAACSVSPQLLTPGAKAVVRASATSPSGLPLQYSWFASGGTVEGSGPEVRWNSAGTQRGSYTITARVDDARGGSAICSATIRVDVTGEIHPPADMKEFPLPAPEASTRQVLPDSPFAAGPNMTTLRDMDRVLSTALDQTGYGERSYLWVPDGFALVTRLEQIYPDGRPKPPPARFSAGPVPLRTFSLGDYLRALFTADPGYYRVLVFVVTPHDVSETGKKPTDQESSDWLHGGAAALPSVVAEKPRPPEVRCVVLVYEFENKKTTATTPAVPVPSDIDAKTHLQKAGIWTALHLP